LGGKKAGKKLLFWFLVPPPPPHGQVLAEVLTKTKIFAYTFRVMFVVVLSDRSRIFHFRHLLAATLRMRAVLQQEVLHLPFVAIRVFFIFGCQQIFLVSKASRPGVFVAGSKSA